MESDPNEPNPNEVTQTLKSRLRLVTGSCDTTVRVWTFVGDWENNHQGNWKEELKLGGNPHSGMCMCSMYIV